MGYVSRWDTDQGFWFHGVYGVFFGKRHRGGSGSAPRSAAPPSTNKLPQGNQQQPKQPKSCTAAPDVTGKIGIFGDLGIGKLQASLNLLSFNFPLEGGNYLSQGAGVGLKGTRVFGVPLSIGFDRSSFNGGLSFQTTSWQASSESMSVSTDEGISFEIGLGVGFSLSHLENLLNLLVPCAQ